MKDSIFYERRGYIYTALTIGLILLSLSMITFYFTVAKGSQEESLNRISLEELHYLIDDVKKEYGNALEISGRRAAAYSINYVINSSQGLRDYEMQSCNEFNYYLDGAQAALAELMLCGTLFGEEHGEMDNNTLLNWTDDVGERINGSRWNFELEIRNITLVLKDAWSFAIFSTLEISARDRENSTKVNENFSVTGVVSILGLEDPLYKLNTNNSELIRKFKQCNDSEVVDGEEIERWIGSKCYQSSNLSYNCSTFFDRLEGNLNFTEKYVEQHRRYFSSDDIGLESFLNVYHLYLHDLTEYEEDYTWVDYLFWQNLTGDCTVDGTTVYDKNGEIINFWIDLKHQEKYDISGANCP